MIEDPRDKRFYQLQKIESSQLTQKEIAEYISYCNKMIDYVSDKKSRKGWIALKKELEGKSS
jgi:hypothetical protein